MYFLLLLQLCGCTQVPTPIPQVSRSNSTSSITSNIQLLTSSYKSTQAAALWSVDSVSILRWLFKISETWFILRNCFRLHKKKKTNKKTSNTLDCKMNLTLNSSIQEILYFGPMATGEISIPYAAKACINWLNKQLF